MFSPTMHGYVFLAVKQYWLQTENWNDIYLIMPFPLSNKAYEIPLSKTPYKK